MVPRPFKDAADHAGASAASSNAGQRRGKLQQQKFKQHDSLNACDDRL
jgi:hypothetical protein